MTTSIPPEPVVESTSPPLNPLLAAALAYAARGWGVFPCLPQSKKPATAHGCLDATTDPEQIRQWWAEMPDANVAIATGPESGLYVLDVDAGVMPDGTIKRGEESFTAMIAVAPERAVAPITPVQRTGRGGRQFFFLYPKEGDWPNTAATLGVDIDTRGRGGYVVAPPSIHPDTGQAYAWVQNEQVPSAPMPDWLLKELSKDKPRTTGTKSRGSGGGEKAGPAAGGAIPEGQRNAKLTSLAGSMRSKGLDEDAIRAALRAHNLAHCQPPLPEDEVDRIAASIARYEPDAAKSEAILEMARASAGAERATVVLPGMRSMDEAVTLNACAAHLYRHLGERRVMYIRGGQIHEVGDGEDGSELVPLKAAEFAARIQRHCNLWSWMQGDLWPVGMLSLKIAPVLIAAPEAKELLPPIVSILRCPGVVEVDGKLVTLARGYNAVAGGVFVTGTTVVPEIPLVEARRILEELLADFDCLHAADRSRMLAALITPGMRLGRLIPGNCPIDVIEADQSQSGKTYFYGMKASAYGEIPSTVTKRTGGVGSFEESISAALIRGRPFILLDNTRGRIDSQMLESLLTPLGPYGARVPQRPEVLIDPTRYCFGLTSNGAEITRDLANRASVIRIRKRPRDYAYRTWPLPWGGEGDVLASIQVRQPEILGSIHAVIRAWHAAGKPSTGERRHDMRVWAGMLDWIVQEVFRSAPLLDGHVEIQERVGDPRQAWARAVAVRAAKQGNMASWTAARIAEFAVNAGLGVPGAREDADGLVLARRVGVLMGGLFGDQQRVELDGITIERVRVAGFGDDPRYQYLFKA